MIGYNQRKLVIENIKKEKKKIVSLAHVTCKIALLDQSITEAPLELLLNFRLGDQAVLTSNIPLNAKILHKMNQLQLAESIEEAGLN
jgi:hypothetical protein